MHIYPDNALEQLDFYRLLRSMADFAAGMPGKRLIEEIRPVSKKEEILISLSRHQFFLLELDEGRYLQLIEYNEIESLHHALEIEGFVLTKKSFLALRQSLDNAVNINNYFDKALESDDVTRVPFNRFSDLSALRKSLHNAIDESGEILPQASEELMAISKRIAKKQSEITSVFEKFAKQYRSQGLLSEIGESYRNGRRVLALPTENKRKISGIIHGESESGKTVFIEPQAVTEVNNALFSLEQEKQREEYKVLQRLSDELRIYGPQVIETVELLALIDKYYACSVYCFKRGFSVARQDDRVALHVIESYHPHLEDHLVKENKKVVKNSLVLHGQNKMLLLSGPNAGGKSVLLKTIAINQLLFQCGLPTPCDQESKFFVFKKLALDIGDNQSIEDDLSTYSSHLEHMRNFLEMCDRSTLLLIDEFGTGTDPRVGGALAESILHQFVKRGSTAIITTHYSNLKSYAHKMKGIVNGSMSFDMEKLQPTYSVQVGKPGSSFAFEIAERMGLPKQIIAQARKKAGNQVYEMEKLLSQLMHEKEIIATKKVEIQKQEQELKRLTSSYTELKSKLDIQRKKYKAERKEELARLRAENVRELEKKLNEFKKLAETEESIQAELEAQKDKQVEEIKSAKTLHEEAYRLSGEWVNRDDLNIGDYVQIRETDSMGKILGLEKKVARVAVGALSVDVPYESLVKASNPIEIKSQRSIQYSRPNTTIPSRLDIRGMSFKEAKEVLVKYFDDALVRHMHQVEILHGRGNGVLRKLVRQVARDYKEVSELRHPEEEAGGEGMTIIRF